MINQNNSVGATSYNRRALFFLQYFIH